MCDERERLIEFVYDECSPADRQTWQRHLEACETCRQDVTALRAVRQDLLAWDVPAHDPIWRPLVAMPMVTAWRQVPFWALAAAASLMFSVGAAGGVATHVALARSAAPATPAVQAPDATAARATPVVEQASVSPDDLAALEARLLARVREAEQRAQASPMRVSQPVVDTAAAPSAEDYAGLLREVREMREQQYRLNFRLVNDVGALTERTKAIEKVGYSSVGGNR